MIYSRRKISCNHGRRIHIWYVYVGELQAAENPRADNVWPFEPNLSESYEMSFLRWKVLRRSVSFSSINPGDDIRLGNQFVYESTMQLLRQLLQCLARSATGLAISRSHSIVPCVPRRRGDASSTFQYCQRGSCQSKHEGIILTFAESRGKLRRKSQKSRWNYAEIILDDFVELHHSVAEVI